MVWPAIIGAGASIVGGLISAKGQRDTNRLSAREAKLNRDWQERMSNTAVQRRMADMKEGGINPLLAARYDATTPPGAMANYGNVGLAGVQGATMVANSAQGLARLGPEMEKIEAETDRLAADMGLKQKQASVLAATATFMEDTERVYELFKQVLTDHSDSIQGFVVDQLPTQFQEWGAEAMRMLKDEVQGIKTYTEDTWDILLDNFNALRSFGTTESPSLRR